MAVAILDNVTKVDNVSTGSNFTVSHAVGAFALDRLKLELGGDLAKAHISKIALRANTLPFQEYETVAHLEAIRAYYGAPVNSSEIAFGFLPTHFKHEVDAIRMVLGLENLTSFTVTGKISSTPVNPTMKAVSRGRQLPVLDIPGAGRINPNRTGFVTKVRNFSKNLSGAGTTDIVDIPRNEGWLQAIHIFHTGNVTGAQLWAGRVCVWNTPAIDGGIARMQSEVKEGGRTPQTNVLHIDTMLSNELGDELPLAGLSDFRLKLDHSGNDNVVIYVEYLGGIPGVPA